MPSMSDPAGHADLLEIIAGLKQAACLAETAFLEVGGQFQHIGALILGGATNAPALNAACGAITIDLQLIDRFLQHQMAAIAALEAWHAGLPLHRGSTTELLTYDAVTSVAELF